MKKIKKISLVNLAPPQMKELVGGNSCYTNTLGPSDPGCDYSTMLNIGTSGSGGTGSSGGGTTNCGCSCGNCSMDTMGMGASIGFARTIN